MPATDGQSFPSIPARLRSYLDGLPQDHPVSEAFRRRGRDRTFEAISGLFRITSQNTDLSTDDLLRDLGFDPANRDRDHIQSMFGVMRSINILAMLGFTNIRPLPPVNNRRECDLLAERNAIRYAVEVFRSSELAYRFPDHSITTHDLQSYVAQRYSEKRSQLEATMGHHDCTKAILAVVMDSQPASALVGPTEWPTVAQASFERMGSPSDSHLLIFTGMADPNTGGDEYAVYPVLRTVLNEGGAR